MQLHRCARAPVSQLRRCQLPWVMVGACDTTTGGSMIGQVPRLCSQARLTLSPAGIHGNQQGHSGAITPSISTVRITIGDGAAHRFQCIECRLRHLPGLQLGTFTAITGLTPWESESDKGISSTYTKVVITVASGRFRCPEVLSTKLVDAGDRNTG